MQEVNQRQLWNTVDGWFEGLLVEADPAFEHALSASRQAGLPDINVSPSQGKFLHLLARMCGARSILEIGTLGGYSTIWLARALPEDGRLVTLELSSAFAQVARTNIENAGLADKVEIVVGQATDTLSGLSIEEPFDFIFIDADKENNPHYLTWALRLSCPGTVIVADNVVRQGSILDDDSESADVKGMRGFCEMVAAEPRLSSTVLQTVGSKGWDGMAIVLVTH